VPMDNLTVDGIHYSSIEGGDTPALLWHSYMKAAITAEPDLAGTFPTVWNFTGRTLTPPDPDTLGFPEGMGGTTTTEAPATTVPPSTSTSTSSTSTTTSTVPSTTTTEPETTTSAPDTTTTEEPTTTEPETTTEPDTTTPTTTPDTSATTATPP
jgi:hypothetical protein